MSDGYKVEDLRVNPFIQQKKLYIKARFPCPLCGDPIEMQFSGEQIKELYRGYQAALLRKPK